MANDSPRHDAVPLSDDVPTRAQAEATPAHLKPDTQPSTGDASVPSDAFATAATPAGQPPPPSTDWATTAPESDAATRGPEPLTPIDPAASIGRLGHYSVIKTLGSGGMGAVYEAEDPHLRRRVALKVMLPAFAASASARKRFLYEARAAAAVEHDHIVHIYQVGEENGTPFIAMQLLRGESLLERFKRDSGFPPATILRIGREVAEGLAAAHARGLIHRDVKPGNLWLEPGGRIKILDFGLAKAQVESSDAGVETQAADSLVARSQLTQVGAVVGTPGYFAPEQVGGQPVDARCDLFSLGCVLYQLCVGRLPFPARDTATALASIATEQPKPPCELNPAIPTGLSQLVMHLLAKSPAARPASARHVAQALERLEAQQHKRSTISRTVVAAAMLALGLLGIVIWLSWRTFFPAPPQPEPRPQPVAPAPVVPSQPNESDKILASIVAELRLMPGAVPTLVKEDPLADLSSFKDKSFEKYRVDYDSWADMEKLVQANPAQYAVRSAVLKALKALQETQNVRIKEGYILFGPTVTSETRGFVLKAQNEPATFAFQLEEALVQMRQVDLKTELSERWRAHHEHVRALLMGRIVFMADYNTALAQIRLESLPMLGVKSIGWKLTRSVKVQGDYKVKDLAKKTRDVWSNIAREHADSPWALLVERERQAGLGLEWRADPE